MSPNRKTICEFTNRTILILLPTRLNYYIQVFFAKQIECSNCVNTIKTASGFPVCRLECGGIIWITKNVELITVDSCKLKTSV